MIVEKERTVAVIGGLGKMGVVTRGIFEQAGYKTIVSDIKDPQTLSVNEAIRQSGIVFFSVLPIENIPSIIQSTSDVFDKTHRVLDNTSLKSPLRAAYEILDGKGVSICSTHPLCKEDQPLFGQNVFIASFGQNPQEATLIAEEVYKKAGMVLLRIDFTEHDSLTSFNQLIPHVLGRAIGIVLAENQIDPEVTMRTATANSRLSNFAWWRTLVQNPQISATIIEGLIKHPEGKKILEDLQNAIRRIIEEAASPGRLKGTFSETVSAIDPTGEIRTAMNEETIVILEHDANLRHRSVAIRTESEDQPGLAWAMLGVLKDAGINLNSIRSHITKHDTTFRLGIKSGHVTPEVIKKLEELGFHIISPTAS